MPSEWGIQLTRTLKGWQKDYVANQEHHHQIEPRQPRRSNGLARDCRWAVGSWTHATHLVYRHLSCGSMRQRL
jgi:hypothetical protein